jgi:hypothetical protein
VLMTPTLRRRYDTLGGRRVWLTGVARRGDRRPAAGGAPLRRAQRPDATA